ncbi:MAG TPA: leukotoxin LktA family filamentous adhesin [Gammaproteobacteria bacterium]|nr:leukotoxin LktA family filamentous adhesin [Gammaproteobacteria bacterium]
MSKRIRRPRRRQGRSVSERAAPPVQRLTPITAAVVAVLGTGGPGVAMAAGNVITPNGRTATRLSVRGSVTDITTGTLHGANAFNAFSQFREAGGNTVNLRLPQGARNLVNLVYGGQTVINGVLNAYRNGSIGGNVTFADPEGLVVGSAGVVNVGSLTVSTPTKAFMNRMLDAGGHFDNTALTRFFDGNAPVSPDGRIDIAGQINASGGINLDAAQVLVAASGRLAAGDAEIARGELFRATVNTDGLTQGTRAVAHNGVVRIVGTQSTTLAGQVRALASDGGSVSVTAARVDLASTARVDSSGSAGGGQVLIGGGPHGDGTLASANTTTVAAGARIDAFATSDGDGGHVVVWSDNGTDFGGTVTARGGPLGGDGGQVEVSARYGLDFHGQVDTRAPQGITGDLLLDPNDLYVVDTLPNGASGTTPATTGSGAQVGDFTDATPASASYVTVATLQGLGDTNVTLQAFDTITIGGTASTTSANLDLSGSSKTGTGTGLQGGHTLTLEAGYTDSSSGATGLGDIVFNPGSSIETDGGAVVIDAGAGFTGAAATDGTATLGSITTAGGAITVNAGGSISLPSTATLDSTASGSTAPGAIALTATQEAANGAGLLSASTVYQSTSPVIVNDVAPSATATVDIAGTINGGDVTLSASAQSAASFAGNPQEQAIAQKLFQSLGLPTGTLLQAYLFSSSATAKVTVDSTASITGTSVSLASDAQPSIDLTNQNALPDGTYLSALEAQVNATSLAEIASGASILFNGTAAGANALSVQATAEPSTALAVNSSVSGSGPSITLAYEKANVTTSALVDAGATIGTAVGASDYGVDVHAENAQSFVVKASSSATTSGSSAANAGIAVAISNLDTSAVATEGADLPSASDVTVTAASSTDKNVTSAETDANAGGTAKPPADGGSSQSESPLQSLLGLLLGGVNSKATDASGSDNSTPTAGSTSGSTGSGTSTTGFDLGSALALGFGSQGASASIAPATTINASGNVIVDASNSSPGFHNLASSGAASTEESSTTNGGTSNVGVSLAASLSWQKHTAHADIGAGASVTAARVAVGAQNDTALSFLQPFDEALTIAQQLQQELNGNFSGTSLAAAWSTLSPNEVTNVQKFITDLQALANAGVNLVTDWSSASTFSSNATNIISNLGPQALNDYNALPTSFKGAWDQSLVGKTLNEIKASVTTPEGMSAYAMATADGSAQLGVAAAVNYLSWSNDTQAWIAPGANVTLAGTLASGSQTSSSTFDGQTVQWDAPLSVQAENGSAVLDGAGNGFLKFFGVTPASSSSVGVGGAFDWTDYRNVTNAWVANGATLTTRSNDVSVTAGDVNRAFSFTPSGGKGGGYAGNGAVAVTRIADQTTAEIDNAATVQSSLTSPLTVPTDGVVDIGATSEFESFSLSGAVVSAQGAGIGIGVAVNLIDPTTTAGIGDTTTLSSAVGPTPATSGNCTSTACIRAGGLDVQAQTTGAVVTLAVAGAQSGGTSSSTGGSGSGSGSGSLLDSIESGASSVAGATESQSSDNSASAGQGITIGQHRTTSAAADASGKLGDANSNSGSQDQAQGSLQNDYQSNPGGAADSASGSASDSSTQPKMSIAAAGSVAVNDAHITTTAVLDGAKVTLGGSGTASVTALRNTSIIAAAGAAALSRTGGSSSGASAAIAGTLGMNLLDSTTEANLVNGTVLDLNSAGNGVDVQALAGGQAVSVGLGVSINTASGQNSLASIVGSGSVSVARDSTQALVSDSTLQNPLRGDAVVQAYDSTDIGTGGGAFYTGGKAGIGIALSVAMTGNDTRAQVLGSDVTGFSNLDVQAYAPAQIVSAAAVGGWGGSSQVLTLSGAVVVDQIANSTEATIGADGSGNGSTVTVSSGVNVTSTSQDNAALGALLPGAWTVPFDFSGSALPALSGSMGGASSHNQSSAPVTAGGTSNATPGASVIAVAGSASLGSSKASLGISAVYGGIDDNTRASIANATITAGPASGTTPGTVTVSADNAARVISVAVGVGVTSGKLAGVGSFTINNLGGTTAAALGDGNATTDTTTIGGVSGGPAPDVSVTATDAHTVWSAAGGLAGAGTVAAGAAMALNLNRQTTQASVDHVTLNAGNATVEATSSTGLYSGAVAGAASSNIALGGSLDVTFDQGTTRAGIADSALTLAGDLTDSASDSGNIWDGAGALSFSGSGAVGIAAAVNVALHDVEAGLSSSTLSAPGQTVTVSATRSGTVAAGAIGAQASGDAAGGLAVVANVADDTVDATVSGLTGSGTPAQATLATLDLSAGDAAKIYALSGELAGSGSVAIGGAVAVNWLGQSVAADLTGSTIAATDAVDVIAAGSGEIDSLAGAIGGSGSVALGGAVGVNITSSQVSALASGDTLVDSESPDVTVSSSNDPAIRSLAIGATASGEIAAGLGVAVNRLGDATSAAIDGGSIHAQNVIVSASSGGSGGIGTLALGVAVSGVGSAAGSVVTNVLTAHTTADITGGAQVLAVNNALVAAADQNRITAATGAFAVGATGAGVGLGVTVDVLGDDTEAYVGLPAGSTAASDGTSVDALALGPSGELVASGALVTQPGVDNLGDYTNFSGPSALSETTTSVHGLAINAESLNIVTGLSATAATAFDPLGSAALDASTVTNVMGGKTLAYSAGANLDTAAGAATNQELSVIASRHDFAANLVIGAAAGATDVAAAGALGVNSFDATTRAWIEGGQVSPQDAVTVLARASQDSYGLGAGLSAALAGAAGTGMVDVFRADTEAYVQGLTLTANSLSVNARDRSAMNLISGSGAFGAAAIAGTALVVDGDNTTLARVGDPTGQSATDIELGSGNLDIGATSISDLWTLAVSGSGAGGLALAGEGSAVVMRGDTEAHLDNATVVGHGIGPVPSGGVSVSASDTTRIEAYAGALAAGGTAGVGAGANIVVLHQTVAGAITGSTVTMSQLVDVSASSDKYVNMVTATGAVGGSAGIGGAAGLILLGSGDSGQAMDALDKNGSGTLSGQSRMSDAGNSAGADGNLSTSEQGQVAGATSFDLAGAVGASAPDATTAKISSSTVGAGAVTVTATDTTTTQNLAGAAGVGVGFGFGAGIAVTRVYDTVGATILSSTITAPAVNVAASTGDGSGGSAVSVTAYDGAAGLGFGLGAAIADGAADATVNAGVSGGSVTGDGSGSLSVSSSDGESVQGTGGGATAGAVSVGAVVVTAHKSGTVNAGLATTADRYDGISIDATGGGSADASAKGVSAGIYSGNAAAATATDDASVTAGMPSAATITNLGGDGVQINATSAPVVHASALGVSVGVGSVGASVANATSSGSVSAGVAGGTQISGSGQLALRASGTPTVTSHAVAGTGSLVGAQGVVSNATNDIHVTADTGTGVRLPDGAVLISARQVGAVGADGTGVLVSGLGAGAVVVSAGATPWVTATLGAQASSSASRSGDLEITANGSDSLSAQSTSGAGGGGIANAAQARTDLQANTLAQTLGTTGTVHAGTFVIDARHNATVSGTANSTQVALAGFGAASASNVIDSTVQALYGAGTDIQAASGSITASNVYAQPAASGGWDANGAAGGAFNVNLISASTTLTLTTQTQINGGDLEIVGDPSEPSAHTLVIGASNDVTGAIGSKVATGGVVQGLTANATFNATMSADVTVASGATVGATGNIYIYAGSSGQVSANALSHTWGGAGVTNSGATATLSATQDIAIAGMVRSSNDIAIEAGYDRYGSPNDLSASATSHAYNYTALAVGTNPSAYASVTNHNNASVSGSVLAGGNATLAASNGQHAASASATGKNSYQKVVEEIVNFFVGLINKIAHKQVIKPVTLEYHGGSSSDNSSSGVDVSGTVEAGLAGTQDLKLTLNAQGQVVAGPGTSPLVHYSVTTWDYAQYLQDQIQSLQTQMADTTDTTLIGRLYFEQEKLNAELAAITNPSTGQPYAEATAVPFVTVDPILVRSGNVSIRAGSTSITGTVKALPLTGVSIENPTPAFMQVGDITVEGGSGGKVDINGTITGGASGTTPTVSIDSSFTPSTGSSDIAPDIFLNGTIYNPLGSVVVQDSAGSIHNQGTINGGSVSIAALNGGYFQGYQSGFHTPGEVVPITDTATVIAGGPVFVAAEFLNVDGLIQSGHDHLAVSLSSSLDSQLNTWETEYAQGTSSWNQYVVDNNLPVDPTTGYVRITLKASISNPDIIPAFWDPATNEIVLNAAQSQPGRVYLYGSIFNTSPTASDGSPTSNIVAAGGLANISVDNQTDLPLVVQGLDAGSANSGGLVQITDTARTIDAPDKAGNMVGYSQVTEYRYDPQTGVTSVYHYAAGAPGTAGQADSATLVDSFTGTSDSYSIENNGGGVWYVRNPVTLSSGGGSYTVQQGLYRPSTADLSVTVPTSTGLTYTVTYTIGSTSFSYDNVPAGSPLLLFCSGFCTATPNTAASTATITQAWNTLSGAFEGDYPVGISFVGQSHGTINVTSPAGIWLKGDVKNVTGDVTLSADSGVLGSLSRTATVTGQNVTLTGSGGIGDGALVGTRISTYYAPLVTFFGTFYFPVPVVSQATLASSDPVNVSLVGSGILNATSSGGNIDLSDAQGGLTLGQVSAPTGFVRMDTQGSIVAGSDSAPVIVAGSDLSLNAGQGGIHGATGSTDALGINIGGTLNVDAPFGVVDLAQASAAGDLSVGRITAGGDVTLAAPGGSIVSALAQTTNQKGLTALQQQWSSFGLTGTAAQDEGSNNLTHIVGDFTFAYGQYWSIKNDVTFTGSGSSMAVSGLTASGYADYRAAAAAYNGIADPASVTQAQILGYVQNVLQSDLVGRYQALGAQLGQLTADYGFQGSQIDPYLTAQDAGGFAQTVTGGLQSTVTQGVAWTQDQLLNTVNQQAVFGTAASYQTQAPNITTPGTVTLLAGTAGASDTLGSTDAPITIQGGSGTLTLTPLQEAALAAAAPGDITIGSNASGPVLTVNRYHPVYVQGAQRVDAAAQAGLYLAAGSGDLNVGTIVNPQGEIRLSAAGSLLQAPGGEGVSGGALGVVLDAANGTIGTAGAPVQLAVTGPLDSAKASSDVYLEQSGGPLDLGNFFSGGTGSITVNQGGIAPIFTDATVPHVQAQHLVLDTTGPVGGDTALAVTLGSGGLSGQVGGALNVVSPTADLAVHGLTAQGPVSLQTVSGNMTLDGLRSAAAGGTAITLAAAGSITGDSPSGADVAAPASGASVSLTAGTGIGSASRYLVLDTPLLGLASTTTGDIYLGDLQGLTTQLIHAPNGTLGLRVAGDLTFTDLLPASGLDFSATGSVSGGHAAVTSGDITGSAGGALSIGTVSAPDAVTLSAAGGNMTLGTLTASQAILSARDGIDLHQAYIEKLIRFYSGALQAVVDQQKRATGPLEIALSGWQGGIDGQVDLSLDAPGGIVIDPLRAGNGTVRMAQDAWTLRNGYVTGEVRFITPQANVLMTNGSTALQPADVQLYQRGESFYLTQNGNVTVTNAFTEHYMTGYRVIVPNYIRNHQQTPTDYGGGSAYISSGAIAGRQPSLAGLLPQLRATFQMLQDGFAGVVGSPSGGALNLTGTGARSGRGEQ